MAAAIELRKRGVQVDLVEIDGAWRRSYGAGISLSGATLRAENAGILDEFLKSGYGSDGQLIRLQVRSWRNYLPCTSPVPTAALLVQLSCYGGAGDGSATLRAGVDVQLGCSIHRDSSGVAEGVEVEFTV
jgi:hypothetical protein